MKIKKSIFNILYKLNVTQYKETNVKKLSYPIRWWVFRTEKQNMNEVLKD